jgi:hypothetical protein
MIGKRDLFIFFRRERSRLGSQGDADMNDLAGDQCNLTEAWE